jgi:transposase
MESLEGTPFKLFRLPSQSSFLNPIERVWASFKRYWKNHLCQMEGTVTNTNFEEHVDKVLCEIKNG